MSNEACIIIIDNSELSRNSDFTPTRFQAQVDAITLISRNKTAANPENVVGLVDTTGPTCHMSLVTDRNIGKLLSNLHKIKIKGETNFLGSVKVAQLALKYRQNKRQDQRIVAFIGSPVSEPESELKLFAMKLKRNGIKVDVVSFGEYGANAEKLRAFVDEVDNGGNSHYVEILGNGSASLTEALANTQVFAEDMVATVGDNLDDAVFQMVLRMSLEEAQSSGAIPPPGEENTNQSSSGIAESLNGDIMAQDSDMLAQTIAMSIEDTNSANNGMDIDLSNVEDPDLALVLHLSMQDAQPSSRPEGESRNDEQKADSMDVETSAPDAHFASNDHPNSSSSTSPTDTRGNQQDSSSTSELMSNIIRNLPGIDPSDSDIQNLLSLLQEEKEKKDKDHKDHH
ncbi:uncharacterized protein LOC126318224 [Schistocerca gregaria]|uniref:uncharacterized protein LOC126318224 n=1 Tax=Schistocerca gregaria TaxID=7010 RepID=UPI00211EC984|nr:uncharacterized protein LOC126318224 [Schistocerca gregaria]